MERGDVDTVIDLDQVAAQEPAPAVARREGDGGGACIACVLVVDHRALPARVVAQAVREPELEHALRSRGMRGGIVERVPWTEPHAAS
jgi:hypothetical protein